MEAQREDHGDSHHGVSGDEQHFLDLPIVEDQRGAAAAEKVGQRRRSTSSVHWLTFEKITAAPSG